MSARATIYRRPRTEDELRAAFAELAIPDGDGEDVAFALAFTLDHPPAEAVAKAVMKFGQPPDSWYLLHQLYYLAVRV